VGTVTVAVAGNTVGSVDVVASATVSATGPSPSPPPDVQRDDLVGSWAGIVEAFRSVVQAVVEPFL
jgi:hypothetical protein